MEEHYNKHYVRLDKSNNIIRGFSDAFEQPCENDICINDRGGRHFMFKFSCENPPLMEQGVYLYKCLNNKIIAKTPEEIQAEIPTSQPVLPTMQEQIQALSVAILELAGEIYG